MRLKTIGAAVIGLILDNLSAAEVEMAEDEVRSEAFLCHDAYRWSMQDSTLQ